MFPHDKTQVVHFEQNIWNAMFFHCIFLSGTVSVIGGVNSKHLIQTVLPDFSVKLLSPLL